MTQNLRLVKYFMSEFYKSKTSDLAHIASPSFVFQRNNGKPLDFDQYALSKAILAVHAEIEFEELKSDNDVVFYCKWTMRIPDEKKIILTGVGQSRFIVKNGLLQKVHVSYDTAEYVFEYYDKLCALSLLEYNLTQ